MRRRATLVGGLACALVACSTGGGIEGGNIGGPGGGALTALAAGGGVLAYGQECADAIGEIPAFDCTTGSLARITVNGVEPEPSQYSKDMKCDRPALLPPAEGEKTDGQCVPYSRALSWDSATIQIAAFCRQKLIRGPDTHLYDEIDVIAHSVTTGATCWFQAKADNPNGDPFIGLDGRRVPPPNEVTPPPGHPSAASFWRSPEATAGEKCGECHDNDPFYYSPFVAQTGELPADPFGKYENIGEAFGFWKKPRSIEPRGNTCTGCHRIGASFTCEKGALESIGIVTPDSLDGRDEWARRYPQSHWMPVGNLFTERQWDVVYGHSIDQLTSCCADPDAPECHTRPIPPG